MDFYNSKRVDYKALVSNWEKEDAYLGNKLDRLFTMYEMAQCETEQIHRDIETKIYVEGGTFEDLDYLYTEAEEQNNEKKVGLLTKIINFFKGLIDKIKKKISSLFDNDDDIDVEVPKEQLGMIEKIIEHFNKIKAAFSKIISGNILSGLGDLLGAAKFEFAAVGSVAAIVTLRKSKLKEKYKVLQNINDTIDKCMTSIDGFMKKNIKEGGVLDKLITGAKTLREKFFDGVAAAVNAAGKWIMDAIEKAKGGKKKDKNAENTTGENKDSEGDGSAKDTDAGTDNKDDKAEGDDGKKTEESYFDFWSDDDVTYYEDANTDEVSDNKFGFWN